MAVIFEGTSAELQKQILSPPLPLDRRVQVLADQESMPGIRAGNERPSCNLVTHADIRALIDIQDDELGT